MRYKTKIAGIFSILLVLLINPAYADVTSLKTDKPVYKIEDKIVFSGTSSEPGEVVNVAFYNPDGIYIIIKNGAVDSDGNFSLIPIAAESIFSASGIYEAIAFAGTQPKTNGTTIFLEYSDGKISVAELFDLNLNSIGSKNVDEEKTLSFTVSVTDPTIENLIFSLEKNPPSGASIDPQTGKFTWTPTKAQGPASYIFDIVVNAGSSEDREAITVSVNEVTQPIPEPKSEPEPKAEPKPKEPEPEKESKLPSFVDPNRDPQYYIDRYSNEESYKVWFDRNYPEITIYEAVGLENPEPEKALASFVDPNRDPQYYIDRYNNEESYKVWFDRNYPEITIYEAVGLENPEPEKALASFVDPNRDPQYYIDRYNNEESYKVWFDRNYPEIKIYEAVGLPEPDVGICGPGTKLVEGVCKIVIEPNGGGCLIATAAFGTELAPQVQKLREIRDNTLLETNSGSAFMTGFNEFYYSFSPTIADWERQNPTFKEAVKLLITPLLTSLSILNHVDIDSEASMLGYGIGIIMMNVGMYFIIPITVIIKLKKRFHYI